MNCGAKCAVVLVGIGTQLVFDVVSDIQPTNIVASDVSDNSGAVAVLNAVCHSPLPQLIYSIVVNVALKQFAICNKIK